MAWAATERAAGGRSAIGEMLRDLRLGLGMSQDQLAAELNRVTGCATMTRNEISRYENGHRVPVAWLPHLAAVLQVAPESFAQAGDEEHYPGNIVRRARQRRGLSLEVAAGLIGRSKAWLSMIETGQMQLDAARFGDVVALARVLKVHVPALTSVACPGCGLAGGGTGEVPAAGVASEGAGNAAGAQAAQLPAHRSCRGCGAPLSRYNPAEVCSACTSAARNPLPRGTGGCVHCGGGFAVPPSARLPLGQRLAELRRGCGLTQQELADRAHVSLSLVAHAERGQTQISAATLSALCAALGVPATELFTGLRAVPDEPGEARRLPAPRSGRVLGERR
jgi:transcriptional regulator with XRE-family HTH domain